MCNSSIKSKSLFKIDLIKTFAFLKSEVAIASLLRQTKQQKKILLEVKTITNSPGNGTAESVKSCNLQKKGQNSLVLKLKNDFK